MIEKHFSLLLTKADIHFGHVNFDDLLNIDITYFEGMVNQIYPTELQLNKANNTDTEAPFLDLHLYFEMDSFLLKFMINAMTLILI